MPREEDQDEVVLLGRSREKRPKRPLEIAESGLSLRLVGEEKDVLLLEPALAHQHLVNELGIGHRVAELGNGRALVGPHSDHHRPLLAAGLGGQHRLRRRHGRRTLVHHGANLLADGAVGLAGADDDGVAPFAELDGRGHRDRLPGRALRLLQDLGAVEEHVDRRDALARADLGRHQARLIAHPRAVLRMTELHGQGHDAIEEHRADVLLGHPVGVGGGDHDGVLPVAQLERQVHGKRSLRRPLLQA